MILGVVVVATKPFRRYRMGHRILSREELEVLTPEGIAFIYNIIGQDCSPETIEKTLLQAGLISRVNQCKLDANALAFLFERICESDTALILEAGEGERDSPYRYC